MSCCGNRPYYPYEPVKKTWTPEGDLIQNNYSPPDGWPADSNSKWPIGVTEGFCCQGAQSYTPSFAAWTKVGNVTRQNTPGSDSYSVSNMPSLIFAERYSGYPAVSASNFSTLENTWRLPKPYTA